MPIYEYRCKTCDRTFEQFRSIRQAEDDIQCPNCRSEEVERILSSFSTGGGGCGAPAGTGGRRRFT